MIALALRLLPIWQWIKSNPLLCLCVILAIWGAYERHQAAKWQDRAIACQMASQAAAAQTKAMREREARDYQEKARHADQEHAAALADARAATDAYIRSHRVRPSGGVSAPAAIGQASDASVREEVPADTDVAVKPVDVQGYSDCAVYAVKLREWAVSVSVP